MILQSLNNETPTYNITPKGSCVSIVGNILKIRPTNIYNSTECDNKYRGQYLENKPAHGVNFILQGYRPTNTNNVVSTIRNEYNTEYNIDFDEASEAWMQNKRKLGNGMYKYVCAKRGRNNNMCISKCLSGEIYCKTHLYLTNKST